MLNKFPSEINECKKNVRKKMVILYFDRSYHLVTAKTNLTIIDPIFQPNDKYVSHAEHAEINYIL